MSVEVEETVIVTVSLVGMAEVGTGTASFNLDLSNPQEALETMYRAFNLAMGKAMGDVFPAFQNYTREKYGDMPIDNEDDS